MKRRLQRDDRAPQSELQPRDLNRPSLDLSRAVYLTTSQAAEYLQLPSIDAVYRRVRSGAIPAWCYTRLGRQRRFIRAALDELLQPKDRQAALNAVRRSA